MEHSNQELLKVAEAAARAAGTLLKGYTAHTLSSSGKDIKIDADKDAHRAVLAVLETSGVPVLSEEGETHDFGKELQWIVDPLDGSLNFLRDNPACAVSVALVKDGEPVLGIVYDFIRDELFTGMVGEGATLNGKPIVVSTTQEKGNAVLMTGFPSFTDYSTASLGEYVAHVQTFKKVRLIGSAALSLAYVACGRADAYFEKDIKIWDVAAGLALVKAAGGFYTKSAIKEEGKCTVSAGNKEDIMIRLY